MEKDTLYIDRKTLLKLGIFPKEAIEYIEHKKAKDIHPVHVKTLLILREELIASS